MDEMRKRGCHLVQYFCRWCLPEFRVSQSYSGANRAVLKSSRAQRCISSAFKLLWLDSRKELYVFLLWTNWIHLVTCSEIEFRELHWCIPARRTKSMKFTLLIAVHRGGLAKNHFWLVATQKKRIGEQLNYFWNMCPTPVSYIGAVAIKGCVSFESTSWPG